MSVNYDRTYNRNEEQEETYPRKNTGAIIMMIVLAIGIIAVLIYTYIKKNTSYVSWEKTASSETISEAECLRTDGGFILYNRDGAEGHNLDGTVIWKISYDFASPIASACGGFAAFADRGAHTVRVTDSKGANYSINVSEKISEIDIAAQGVTAIRTDAGEADHIYLYSLTGELLLDIMTEVRKAGFPVSMALNSDGRKLVTSYVKAQEQQQSWITFYNFGEVGQSYADKIVGSYSFDDSFIPDVRFITDDRVLVAGTDKTILYKFREIPEVIKEFENSSNLISVSNYGRTFALGSKQASGLNKISIYDPDGTAVTSIETGMNYDNICLGNDEIIMTVGESCIIYRKNGKEKFRAKLDGDITLMYPTGLDATYTVVYGNTSDNIRLKKKSEENQAVAGSEENY